ncbi:MAG: hypothetical protein ACRBFS_21640 [Aureispira sp.]
MKNAQPVLIMLLIAALFLQQQCQREQTPAEVIHTETRIVVDSQRPPPIIVRMNPQAPPTPIIIYPDEQGQALPMAMVDTTEDLPAHLYRDSIEDANQTIYTSVTVRGELLASQTSYQLKIPTVVTKTIETTKTIQKPISSLVLTGGVGVTHQNTMNVAAGLQFTSAKGWIVGYEYDFVHQAHEVKLGLPIYQFKPPKRVLKNPFR